MRPHEKKKGEISLDLFCEDVAAGDMTFGDKCPASSLETVSNVWEWVSSIHKTVNVQRHLTHRAFRASALQTRREVVAAA
jgi:hypothetical protein